MRKTSVSKHIPKTPVNARIPTSLVNRARTAGISLTDAMEYGVRAYLGQATQSEITGGARKLIEQLEQKSGTTEDDLRCLAGIKKILSILEEEIPVSKEEIDAYIESYSLTSVYCKTLAIADPETDALLNASVKNVNQTDGKTVASTS